VLVKGRGGDESAEGGSVHDEKQRTENGALVDATGGGIEGRESDITMIACIMSNQHELSKISMQCKWSMLDRCMLQSTPGSVLQQTPC